MFFDPAGTLRFSPSDLIAFLEGDFVAWMERLAAEQARSDGSSREAASPTPDPPDPTDALVQRKGREHEARYLVQLKAAGRQVVEIPQDGSLEQTRLSMAAGAEIIYQAHLAADPLHGYPDFLVRVSGPSRLGDYHYEPWDTKLAKSSRPYFLVQLCAYADLLESAQGVRPSDCAVVLGTGEVERFRIDEYFYYYRNLKRACLEFQDRFDSARQPDPGLEHSFGRWSDAAERILAASDHLSRVAGITRRQVQRLEASGVKTLADLAGMETRPVPGVAALVRDRLRAQARQQLGSRPGEPPSWEFAAPRPDEPRRGLTLLPPPSKLDVWFDMEGFPFAEPKLEYLFGAVTFDQGNSQFHDWWAHDPTEEKRAFERFIDWVFDRWTRDPAMHIYHYAAYERTALEDLMGRHATREAEVDALFRGGVLVDLYAVTRQGMIIGTPSYSLKDVEHLVAPPRATGVGTAADSTVAYQQWIDLAEARDWRASPILDSIRRYNKDDCENTRLLHTWLLERQRESGLSYIPEPAETVGPEAARKEPTEAQRLAADLLSAVERGEPVDPERRRVTQLLAWLLEFHRREDKPTWWRYFKLLESDDDQRDDDPYCLSNLVRTTTPRQAIKKSWGYEYRFDPEKETKFAEGSECVMVQDPKPKGEITRFDVDIGLLEVKFGPKVADPPDRLTLILYDYVNPEKIASAVHRFVAGWHGGNPPGRAAEDLLFRRAPRLTGHPGGPLPANALDGALRMLESCLCIQGPPGSGKTWTAAGLIAGLLAAEKRVAVAANSHKVILNLLKATLEARARVPFKGRVLKVKSEDDSEEIARLGIEEVKDNGSLAEAISAPGPLVAGATAFALCREEIVGAFDYLIVDEAGQVSLANVIGMSQAARNIILVGDQMQLAQPTRGTHPGESGRSALEYLLNGQATIAGDFGIFLPVSRRMHPDICRFISEAVYEGRLGSIPETARQKVAPAGDCVATECGIVVLSVAHEGCGQESDEEVAAIASVVEELATRQVTSQKNQTAPLDRAKDLLFVAPFNAQVRQLSHRLGPAARIGSVDRFQGQEAPVSIISMCSSTLDDAPRGARFLLNRNRLNVAVSRAQALAIVVASPALLAARSRTLEEMRLVNFFCRLWEYGSSTASGADR